MFTKCNDVYFCVSEGTSQFGFLELSQSQDLRGEVVNSREEDEDIIPQPDSETRSKLGIKTLISLGLIHRTCTFLMSPHLVLEKSDFNRQTSDKYKEKLDRRNITIADAFILYTRKSLMSVKIM